MINLTIDNKPITVQNGITILQACQEANIEIPRFCYHERLSIAGNCRMCLVEVEKSPKPVASCAMPAMDNMVIYTNTPLVKKAREGIMEFLLVNHPLDCPICDQGGECDLQDQSMVFGNDRGRYYEYKRAVEDKNWGPLIKTIMTRCIHCTRCVRFATEVAGVTNIGVSGRGNNMEIGTYVESTFDSELSGNVIDLCPVGALTSKPYAFTARSWELRKTESIDVLDSVGSNIIINTRGYQVMRVLPRLNEFVNEEWINDKTRFSYDGLKRQRLNKPMMRKEDGTFVSIEWKEAFTVIKNNMSKYGPNEMAALSGELVELESLVSLKDLFNKLGSNNTSTVKYSQCLSSDLRSGYICNVNLEDVEKSDVILLVGVNPRLEATLLNTRIRKKYLRKNLIVGSIGSPIDTTYFVEHLGNTPTTLLNIAEGRHKFYNYLEKAEKPLIIFGNSVMDRQDKESILRCIHLLSKRINLVRQDWNGLNFLNTGAGDVGALDIGFVPGPNSKLNHLGREEELPYKLLYLLGADEIDLSLINKDTFVIYQGHHGDKAAYRADIILPGVAYTEKNGLYVNLEGRPQSTKLALSPPGEAREDWKIIRALSEILNISLNYNTSKDVLNRLYEIAPHLKNTGKLSTNAISSQLLLERLSQTKSEDIKVYTTPFSSYISDYYQTNSISRSSQIMAKCSLHKKNKSYTYPNIY